MNPAINEAMAISRKFAGEINDLQTVFEAERTIAEASVTDKRELVTMLSNQAGDGYLHLWLGLMESRRGDFVKACESFSGALAIVNHWRVMWYLAQAAKSAGCIELVDKACKAVMDANPQFWFARELPKHARGYYSQLDQETIIEEFFSELRADKGFFVEVGAFDGVHYSNVRRMNEQHGWSGIAIEPVEKNFKKLRESYVDSNVICVQAAAGDHDGETEINVSTYPHLPDWGSDVATLCVAETARWSQFTPQWEKQKVPLKRLTSLLEEHDVEKFDLLSVDAEGYDLNVLQGLDFKRYQPRMVVVEYGTDRQPILDFMSAQGYSLLLDNKQDMFFVVIDHVAALTGCSSLPPTINYIGQSGSSPDDELQHKLENELHQFIDKPADEVACIVLFGENLVNEMEVFASRYPNAELHAIEQIQDQFGHLKNRFSHNPRIYLHDFSDISRDGSAHVSESASLAVFDPTGLDSINALRGKAIDLFYCSSLDEDLEALLQSTKLLSRCDSVFAPISAIGGKTSASYRVLHFENAFARHGFYLAGVGLSHLGNGQGKALWRSVRISLDDNKRREIEDKLNPHLLRIIPIDKAVAVETRQPHSLLTAKRFDVLAKLIYAQAQSLGIDSQWPEDLYARHIQAFNNFDEADGSGKQGREAFLACFDQVIESIAKEGFDSHCSLVPVDRSGVIIDGAHRCAACLQSNKYVDIVRFDYQAPLYDYRYFAERGMEAKWFDAMALEYCNQQPNSYVVSVFPAASGKEEEIRQILLEIGLVCYDKQVALTSQGGLNLVRQIYAGEPWLGDWKNGFAGAPGKAGPCFSGDRPVRVYLIESADMGLVQKAKQKIRALFDIGNHSVHINDTHSEAIKLAQIFFNENSIHFLNHARGAGFERFNQHLELYKRWLDEAGVEQDFFCIDGSGVMAAYGIREARDLDFIHYGYDGIDTGIVNVDSHNSEIHHHVTSRDDIIFNPENHFYVDGVKFASLDIIKRLKQKRNEQKDQVDVALIDKHLGAPESRNVMRKLTQPRKDGMKVVGLVPARNEGSRLDICLKALAMVTDVIIYLDDSSEDNSVEVVESLAQACNVERIIRNSEWARDEPGDRNKLLQAGREIGGTHFIVIDADEIITANLVKDGLLRERMRKLQPGDHLALNWIQLWRSVEQYRFDDSVWTWNYKGAIFRDDGSAFYESDFIHTSRIPANLSGVGYAIEGYEYGLMHFQFVNWNSLLIKQAWYRCLERIHDPDKPVESINQRYSPSKDEQNLGLKPSSLAWFRGYDFFDAEKFCADDVWRAQQIHGWLTQYGKDYFADLEIWDIDLNGIQGQLSIDEVNSQPQNSLVIQGESCFALGDFSRARELFNTALAENPNCVDALNNLGVMSIDGHDVTDALEQFTRALEMDPYHQGVVANLGRVLPQLGRLEDARLIVDAYLAKYPDDPEILELRRAISGEIQRPANVITAVNIDANRNNGLDPQDRRESINEQSGPCGETPQEHSFSSAESLSQRGEAAFAQNNLELAIQYFKDALSMQPEFAEAQCNLAVVYWEQGDHGAAMRHFTCAYELDPCDRNIVVNLCSVLNDFGQTDNVQLVLNAYLQKHSDDDEIRQCFEQAPACGPVDTTIPLSSEHLDSSKIAAYAQPPAGNTERFIEVQPIQFSGSTISAYRAFEDYQIDGIGTGLSAVSSIIRHILISKLGCANPRPADNFHNNAVVSVGCSLKHRASGQTFKTLAPASISDISAEFSSTEGPERINKINEYTGLLREGIDLGSPMYITGTVLEKLGANCKRQHIYMIDGARRISATALNHQETIDIRLICDQEEYADFLNTPLVNGLKTSVANIPWFSGYQTIPLLGLEGERTAYRYRLMDLDILQNKVVMDFGCNTGQASIQACQSGAKKVYGLEGVAETFNAAQRAGALAGFDNLEFLNIDFNDPQFDNKIDQICPGQVDYAFFFSVYRTKELTQRERLFKYIIEKTCLGIFFEGHADPTIDTLDYYAALFDSFGLDYKYLGNSEGPLRPLFVLKKRHADSKIINTRTIKEVGPLPMRQSQGTENYTVSAIVSTYNAEKFIQGRIKDLLNQTLGDQLEIVVIDSGSSENERQIVESYCSRHKNIKYLRTEQREPIYQAWNRGIKASSGKYITNANTDDRLRPDALERLAAELDGDPNIGLVYGDFFITTAENSDFVGHVRAGYSRKPDFLPRIMSTGCHMGPQPMWRRGVHDEIGYFDESYKSAGDYEFWCRLALRYPMKHIPEFLGLYYHNPNGIVNRDQALCNQETRRVLEQYNGQFPVHSGEVPTGFYWNKPESVGKFVNICVVTYNRLEFTRQALTSLVENTRYPHVITVVDNNSTDGTRDYLIEMEARGVIKNLMLLDDNIGVAKASNIAWLQEPDADYYMKFDNDIVIQKPDWLTNMVDAIDRVETLGAVAYNFEPVSYPVKSIDGCQIRPKENGANLGGACILIPKRTEQKLGYWCEDYGLYGEEDADYGFRIALAGLVNAYMEDEDIGFHLPAGKAAVIQKADLNAKDGKEEQIHSDYRQWKDQQRRINMESGGVFENNLRDYQTGARSLYIWAGDLARNLSTIQVDEAGIESIDSNPHPLASTQSKPDVAADQPLRIAVFSLDYKAYACANLRLIRPLEQLNGFVEFRWGVLQESETEFNLDESAVEWADLFIVQRVFPSEQTQATLDLLFKSGKPVVYETDDLLTEPLPLHNPISNEISRRIPYIQNTISNASLITVSTEALKTEMGKYNDKICVLPNLLDDGVWLPKPPNQVRGEITIGYAGTATHAEDLALVESALEQISSKYGKRVRFVFMGFATDRIRALPGFQEAPFCQYQDYPKVLRQLPIDIAIAPLVDSRFNRGKSHVKWLEYSMCGFAGVYSDLPPYNDAVHNRETGLLVGQESQGWFDALEYLIENPRARQRLALAAQQEVVQEHTLAAGSKTYLSAWESVRTSESNETVTGLIAAAPKIDFDSPKALCPEYQKWLDKRALTEADAQLMAERMFGKWTIEPVLHLLMVVEPGQEALLANTLDSLDRQLYKVWGLSVISTAACPDPLFDNLANVEWVQVAENPWQAVNCVVADTAADWVMFIEPGDLVWPQGLFGFADAINRNSDWKFIYSDEDFVDAQYEHTAHCFKPDCNPQLLSSSSYIGNACVVRREALDQVGGFTDLAGVHRHDAALKIMDQFGEPAIGHIADILYSQLSSANPALDQAVVDANTRSLLAQHLDRTGATGTVQGGFLPGAFRVDYRHAESPKISILLAAKDRIGLTEDCVETLIENTDYPSYEILIADYGSEAEDAFDFYTELTERFPDTVRVIDQCKADNASQAINQAADGATGDYLLMLAPNVTFVQSNWLARLMQHAQRPGVGAVGPRIAGIDKTIRHAGYVLGLNGVASSAFQGLDLVEDGYLQRAKLEQNCLAISGACLLVDKESFKRAGGLDEANLQANFWDVDLCLKLGEMDKKIVWTPHASVVQQSQPDYVPAESQDQAEQFKRSDRDWMMKRWREKMAHDPGYNKNLDLIHGGFQLETDVFVKWEKHKGDRPRVMAFPLNSEGCGEYRVRGPVRAMTDSCRIESALLPNHASGGILRTPSTAELLRAAPDVLLLQHTVSDCHIEAARAYKELTDTFLIYGTDDLMHQLPLKNSRRKQIFRDMKHRIRQVLSCCDRMIVSTQPLADAYGNMIEDIHVVPNYLEGAAWGQAQSLRRQGQKPRVGWAGACQHHGDLELIAEVVKATANEVEWVFMGMLIDELKPYVKEFHEGVIFQQYPQKLASLNLDLAIAPLEINPFNEAKGNLRLLEYGMMGWPVVCSDIYPYQNTPVTRVKNTANEWINAIRERVHDLNTAEKEGDFLKAWVEKNWMLEDHLDEWLDALTPISRISAGEKVCNVYEGRASASR